MKKIYSILVCPNCKGPLEYSSNTLVCKKENIVYKIKKDIPIMAP